MVVRKLYGGFAAEDNYFGRAFVHRRFGLLVRLILSIIQPGQIIFNHKDIGLLCTQAATDTTDFTKRACAFTRLLTAAGNRHHIFMAEGNHLNQVPRACLRAGGTAGAFVVVNGSQAVDDMQSVKLARGYTLAVPKAAEGAGLFCLRYGRGSAR